ncbi:MAG TPA: CDP-alcohol phosphatidyltransferase family protein [Candidatus Binatia bacterium]|jgi:cardiolipin synthase|nr:CDP-alcohol phosphatidyltransferase family protein [Candidatus Binatia bacterium]
MLLVHFFVVEILYYAKTGNELNHAARLSVATICDGVDGYIAWRYNQRSELGAILDPPADKLLHVSGIVVLSLDHRPHLQSVPSGLPAPLSGATSSC